MITVNDFFKINSFAYKINGFLNNDKSIISLKNTDLPVNFFSPGEKLVNEM